MLSACGSDPAPVPGADAAPDVAQDVAADRAEASADATPRCSSPGTGSNCMCGAAQGRHICLPGGGYTPCECPDAGTTDAATAEDLPAPDATVDGGCGNTSADLMNCGACGRRCEFPNATPTCNAARCEIGACALGFADCDGTNANGCETDTSEAANCGACRNRCPMAGRCSGGRCETTICAAGTVWCFDACEDLSVGRGVPARNCGACGRSCANGEACVGGRCTNPCPSGRLYCEGNPDLSVACVNVAIGARMSGGVAHCGRCNNNCFAPLTCVDGVCR